MIYVSWKKEKEKKKKPISQWFVSFSQKWEGLAVRRRSTYIFVREKKKKDKVFPNEDLLGVLPLPETIDVHSISSKDNVHERYIEKKSTVDVKCTAGNTFQS